MAARQPDPSPDVIQREQEEGRLAIRKFLQSRTSYDVLPVSFRLIVLDTSLLVKKALNILLQNGIVSAPLWNSQTSKFAGLLTAGDFINVIQYYVQNPEKMDKIEGITLDGLRHIEKSIGAEPLETLSVDPFKSLYQACIQMMETKARRIPLIDDKEQVLVSVLTQYRILKFVAQNCKQTHMLRKPLSELKVGRFNNLTSANMKTPVLEVIDLLVKNNVSAIPIIDKDGILLNVYEAIDVLSLIKGGIYGDLNLSVGEALTHRPDDFEGVYTCTDQDRLDAIMDTIRRSRLHRLFVVDNQSGKLIGIVTLRDILAYILLD